MNENQQKLTTRFYPETRFEVPPVPVATFRAEQDTELEQLKNRLLRQTLQDLTAVDANGFVRRAANEAAALAWETRVPLLVFPGLFEEKTRTVLRQVERQQSIRRRSRELLFT
ncbi:MAG: hypothetical protein U1F65_06380 [Verrucomicrobiota bacterium]